MSVLRASVCRKLGLSVTASQAEIYRVALRKAAPGKRIALSAADEIRIGDYVEAKSRKSGAYEKGTVVRRSGNIFEVKLDSGELVLATPGELITN